MSAREMNAIKTLETTGNRERRTSQGGFTYLEMITTLAVFMLLGLMAQPVFSEMMQNFKLHGATRQVFAEMQKARMTAITENTRCRAHMDTDSGNLHFQRFDATMGEWESMPDQNLGSEDTTGMALSMPDITFSPNGTAPTSGSLTITDATGNYRTIVVSAAGSIRVN